MRITSFSLSKGCYSPDEVVTFLIDIESSNPESIHLQLSIYHLAELKINLHYPIKLNEPIEMLTFDWQPPLTQAGYKVNAAIYTLTGELIDTASCAFDVLNDWSNFPRYGFLTDFSVSRSDPDNTLNQLTRFHINGLQFYDWQYRHDELLAPLDDYIDPLGRSMSLHTVRNLVDSAHRHGMAAMPYLAIYGASAAFWRAHSESALYDEKGLPIPFGEDFLGLMNPSLGTFWQKHLLEECSRTLSSIAFSGLHIDQYGQPRQVWDEQHHPVDLPQAFADFIQSTRTIHPNKSILFNAVSNWPIETLANSPLNFMYIEIWPPDIKYMDIARTVLNAVQLSGGKPVVIALYLPSEQNANIMQANAVIAACGGTRIELGETTRLLTDPYFPKHQPVSESLKSSLISHYDYLVSYGEWMQSYRLNHQQRKKWSTASFQPDFVTIDHQIWVVARQYPDGISLNLVNFTGLGPDLSWETPHSTPAERSSISLQVRLPHKPQKIIWGYPEGALTGPQELSFNYNNGAADFCIPLLHQSGVIFIYE